MKDYCNSIQFDNPSGHFFTEAGDTLRPINTIVLFTGKHPVNKVYLDADLYTDNTVHVQGGLCIPYETAIELFQNFLKSQGYVVSMEPEQNLSAPLETESTDSD